jgi:hypothetical protein
MTNKTEMVRRVGSVGKYDEVLKPFLQLMEKELYANSGKGDRPAWLSMSADRCMLEIYYHAAKLQKAVKDGNGDQIIEYAADIANLSMMMTDLCGALGLAAAGIAAPPEDVRAVVDEPVGQWSDDEGISWCDGNEQSLQSAAESGWMTRTLYRHPQRRLEMADVVKAHMEIPHYPVLTSNQCHALAMKLNETLSK